MRIGASRADRLGFLVFVVLAGLLATLFAINLGNEPDETAVEVSTLADIPQPTPIETTPPLAVPEPTPTPTPWPTAVPPTPTATPTEAPEASTTDGSQTADTGSQSAASPIGQNASNNPAPTQAPAGNAAPNPQPSQPLPTATGVPNPQPSQPLGTPTGVPNPQPAVPDDLPAVNPTGGSYQAVVRATVAQPSLHSSPGGPAFIPTFRGTQLPPVNPTVFGNPLVYPVLAGQQGDPWIQVKIPAGGNGSTAWVQASQFAWSSSNRKIVINIARNTVTVYEGDNPLLSTDAVTGKSSSRTPLAVGWVEEILDGSGPNQGFIGVGGPYGSFAISLGLFSNDLSSFGGSLPKIALHGTNRPDLLGQSVSNGCIRVREEVIRQIAGLVSLGSRVEIISA